MATLKFRDYTYHIKNNNHARRIIMEDAVIFEKMVEILKPYVKDVSALDGVSEKTHILDDLKVNSARLVDIIIKCEDVFDIEIDDDDADTIRTIGDAVSVIKKKLS